MPNVAVGADLAAADDLRAIHTKEALPCFAALLDNADPGIRQQALAGLSMFAQNLPVQMPEIISKMTRMTPLFGDN